MLHLLQEQLEQVILILLLTSCEVHIRIILNAVLTFRPNEMRFVASLWLKNERRERLSSHRSDHVTGLGMIAQFVQCSKNFFSLGCSTSSTLFPTLPTLHSNCHNAVLLIMQVIVQPLHKFFSWNFIL